ncbi:MAG TPA: hypothetical protein VG797_05215, partial [Phycisphaerales bacterium]|nr:hypothetical protein [Phycisphaerales bacterium]
RDPIAMCLLMSALLHVLGAAGVQTSALLIGDDSPTTDRLQMRAKEARARERVEFPPLPPEEQKPPEPKPPEPKPPETKPPAPPEPEHITVGDENGTAESTTWLGFVTPTPTENTSPNPSVVDQPALKMDDASPGAPVQAAASAPAPQPQPSAAQTPPPQQPANTEPKPVEQPQPEQQKPKPQDQPKPAPSPDDAPSLLLSPLPPEPAPPRARPRPREVIGNPLEEERPVEREGDALPKAEPKKGEDNNANPLDSDNPAPDDQAEISPPEKEATKRAQTSPPDEPLTPADPAPPEPSQPNSPPSSLAPVQPPGATAPPVDPTVNPGTGGDSLGDKSDREADFAATKRATTVEAGKPAVAKGLRIKTVRPVLSRYTRAMSSVDIAIVRLFFNREGKVEKIELIRGTGNRDKDRPLVDALYKWRATGKALENLHTEGHPDLIDIEFRVIF